MTPKEFDAANEEMAKECARMVQPITPEWQALVEKYRVTFSFCENPDQMESLGKEIHNDVRMGRRHEWTGEGHEKENSTAIAQAFLNLVDEAIVSEEPKKAKSIFYAGRTFIMLQHNDDYHFAFGRHFQPSYTPPHTKRFWHTGANVIRSHLKHDDPQNASWLFESLLGTSEYYKDQFGRRAMIDMRYPIAEGFIKNKDFSAAENVLNKAIYHMWDSEEYEARQQANTFLEMRRQPG